MGKYIKKADRGPYGPLAKHGGYSVAHKDALLKRHPEIQLYLKVVRRGLIRDTCPEGEEHMTMARHVVLDRLMGKLATVRLIETYLSENGIIRRDKLALKILDAEPITALWMSLNHAIRQDLELLGLDRKPLDITLTPADLADEIMADKAARAAEKGPVVPQDGRSSEDAPVPLGNSDDATGGDNEGN